MFLLPIPRSRVRPHAGPTSAHGASGRASTASAAWRRNRFRYSPRVSETRMLETLTKGFTAAREKLAGVEGADRGEHRPVAARRPHVAARGGRRPHRRQGLPGDGQGAGPRREDRDPGPRQAGPQRPGHARAALREDLRGGAHRPDGAGRSVAVAGPGRRGVADARGTAGRRQDDGRRQARAPPPEPEAPPAAGGGRRLPTGGDPPAAAARRAPRRRRSTPAPRARSPPTSARQRRSAPGPRASTPSSTTPRAVWPSTTR